MVTTTENLSVVFVEGGISILYQTDRSDTYSGFVSFKALSKKGVTLPYSVRAVAAAYLYMYGDTHKIMVTAVAYKVILCHEAHRFGNSV